MSRDGMDVHARWERALERRGPEAVRMLLRISSGHDGDMAFRGLMPEPPDPPRNFVENWLSSREASAGRLGRRLVWPAILLVAAVGLVWAWFTYGDIALPRGWALPF